jgi:alkylation response protein AidB-like acyl-CoA dehydrogenase
MIERPTAEDRAQFQEALRGFLASHWPVESAVEWAADGAQLLRISVGLAEQGVLALGADPSLGGMAEIVVAMEELGRAACPAPVLASMLMNLRLAREKSLQQAWSRWSEAWQAGEIIPAIAFGALDPGGQAGSALLAEGKVGGTLNFVEGACAASHLLLPLPGAGCALLELDDPAVRLRSMPAMDLPGLDQVRCEGAPLLLLDGEGGGLEDFIALGRLACAARALGAARRAFDLVIDYVKERVQFGQAVGSFQAIQHKLANCHIALHAVELSVHHAAEQFDVHSPDWRWSAGAASALAASSLRQVALEIQHAFGAIGYSEEHEAPRHFKRIHVDALVLGGSRWGNEQVAARFLDGGLDFPPYDLGAAGNAFRDEVREWLATHWSGERKRAHDALPFHAREYDAGFAADLGTTGWIGLAWPRQYGGQQRSALEQVAFLEEMERADAPRVGAPVQAAMLQAFGTREQQEKYLPEILRGEAMMGMGYSEPQAGSDLAALRTRAERDGDHYVINGQKIWTTTYWGKYMLLATRTREPAQPPHAGISMFIVPMDTPGITVRPSTTMYGGSFANVFYDDVRVPAQAMLGAEGEGWKVLTGALATERGLVGGGIALKVVHLFELVCGELRRGPTRADPVVRQKLGEWAAQLEAARLMMLSCARALDEGRLDLAEAAVGKVYAGELMERFLESAVELLGLQGALSHGSPACVLNGRIEQSLRHSLMWVISIGTNEIQRTLIAQRGLGLPRAAAPRP